MHKFAREAYDLGVRYIGGCCGFEPYHIRAVTEELLVERGGKAAAGSDKHMPWGEVRNSSSYMCSSSSSSSSPFFPSPLS